MKKLSDIGTQALNWIQPKPFWREYQLLAGSELVATLRWESVLGSLVSIQTADGKWLIRRSGFLWRRLIVHREGDSGDDATFTFRWFRGGVLECPGGGIYRWRRTKFWRPEWAFASASDFPVVRLKLIRVFLKSAGEIELAENASLHRTEVPLLIVIGWYLVLVFQRKNRRR